MKYPNFKTYEILYRKYLEKRSLESLVDLAGSIKSKRVLDLCGGSGRLSKLAIERGAEIVYLVDQEKDMINPEIWLNPKIKPIIWDVESALENFIRESQKFNVVFCRQAINYWFKEEIEILLAEIIVSGGMLIFNTFNQKPPSKPRIKEYQLDGVNYVEIGWLAGSHVHHVQIAEGMAPHVTSFRWLSPKHFSNMLSLDFKVSTIVDGPTTLYSCEKK